jgi:DNA polymerase-1
MFIVTGSNLTRVLEYLRHKPKLALDCETTGLEWSDKLFAITISDEAEDYFFDQELLPKWDATILTPKRLVFKNAKFDMRMLVNSGFGLPKPARFEDITTQARILKNDFYGAKAYSLSALAKREGMEKLTVVDDYIKEHKLYAVRHTRLGESYKSPCFYKVPRGILAEYACKDSRLTYDLSEIYDSRMDEGDRVVFDNECRILPALFDMEMRGIRTDQEYISHGREQEAARLKNEQRYFFQATGEEFTNSKSQLLRIFERAGEKAHLTDKGNPKLDDDVLQSYTSREARIVQKIRFYEKRISTYWDNYSNLSDSRNYIHPTLWPDGTRTGRFSSSEPNLQNVPKEEPAGELELRRAFVPDPGTFFLSIDYKQVEYRMMLDYAKELRLIDKVMAGHDVHQATADLVGISRKDAKTLNFACLYGAGPDKISGMLNIGLGEATKLRTRYFLALPKVEELISKVRTRAKERGFITNWYGRKLKYSSDDFYAAPNGLIQGGCADVLKVAVRGLWDLLQGKETRMVALIHDQVVFCMPDSEKDLVPQIVHAMENVYPAHTKIKLEVDVSYSRESLAESSMQKGAPPP